ncbi:ada2a-containing complex component 3 isoform d [Anaeramoeba ignava]|uniref:Ada2a-containing complex component 3 isoform d n=1 Tax=Anaeramoeba ignava TaxID=1746090 RepID=A0A9Q0LN30_ANAIG|nr:ada2a-containing complex component 3 isoform d [Anaeramoeba ignava]
MNIWKIIEENNIEKLKEIDFIEEKDLKDKTGKSILQFAFEKQNPKEMIELLIRKELDPKMKDKKGRNSIHYATKNNPIQIIEYLISKGIDINAKTKKKETALSISIQNRNKKLIRFLLMNDADFHSLKIESFKKEFIEIFTQVFSINIDLNNLLKSNDKFSDYQIKSNDSFRFKVHKLILLTRFNNDEKLLEKFIEICERKTKEEVELFLNFLYTGFFDFELIYEKI